MAEDDEDDADEEPSPFENSRWPSGGSNAGMFKFRIVRRLSSAKMYVRQLSVFVVKAVIHKEKHEYFITIHIYFFGYPSTGAN